MSSQLCVAGVPRDLNEARGAFRMFFEEGFDSLLGKLWQMGDGRESCTA